jgi:hypothetical protein
MILGSIVTGILESKGNITIESLGPKGTLIAKLFYLVVLCAMAFSLVPLAVRFFTSTQIKIGNGDFFLIKWLTANERLVVYGFWGMCIVGLCIALPVAIRDGFFK